LTDNFSKKAADTGFVVFNRHIANPEYWFAHSRKHQLPKLHNDLRVSRRAA
jgi:hypothetical protein